LGRFAVSGKLSVELASEAAESEETLGASPGLLGNVLGPSWNERLEVAAGEKGLLGVVESVEGADGLEPEKRCMEIHW